jgi:uncharacterized membrane protein (UPF0127 family)
MQTPKKLPKIKKRTIIIPLIIILILGFFYVVASSYRKLSTKTINIDKNPIIVEVANNPISRMKGLSGRKSLPLDRGMLFNFDQPATPEFWMKGMKFPIDIIWIADQKIVAIDANCPTDEGAKRYHPTQRVNYVLEVSAGVVQNNHWQIGDVVQNL